MTNDNQKQGEDVTFSNDPESGNADTSTTHGIYQCFQSDLRESMFSLKESNGQFIDVIKCFVAHDSSTRFPRILFVRLALLTWSVASLIYFLITTDNENRYMFFGYLTNQGLIISILYQFTACIVTIYPKSPVTAGGDCQDEEASTFGKIMWCLYSVSVPLELTVTLSFWFLVYPTIDSKIKYRMIFNHGVLAVLLLIDGNFISRIPVRIKQIVFPITYGIFYEVWTIIHAFTNLGNGNKEGELLYDVIDWKRYPWKTAIYLVAISLIVLPFFFFLVWLLSLMNGFRFNGGRRYTYSK